MKKILVAVFMLCAFQRAHAQFAVFDPKAQIDRIVERIRATAAQVMNMAEYKAVADAARALKKVSSAIRNSEKVVDCFKLVADHSSLYSAMWQTIVPDKNFSAAEKLSIKRNYSSFITQAVKDFSDIKTAILEGNATMNDKERFDLVDMVQKRLDKNYTAMFNYSNGVRAASNSRASATYERTHKAN